MSNDTSGVTGTPQKLQGETALADSAVGPSAPPETSDNLPLRPSFPQARPCGVS